MLFQHHIPNVSFRKWIWQDQENRLLLCLSATLIVAQFIVFKFLYPFPNFMPPDSYSYLDAAYQNKEINMWAIGYSKFLRLFSCFTNSHAALVWCQYGLLEASVFYFLFSVRYLLAPARWLFRLLLASSILNPLLPHISNFVSSDALFASLSLIWFTQLLWILCKPNLHLLLWHSIILLLAFMVRYNALYYPFISIAAVAFSQLRLKLKVLGVGLMALFLGAFICQTEYRYYKETNTVQFSAFGGWQLAANALYGYAHVKPESPVNLPARFRPLHTVVNQHMDSIRSLSIRPDKDVAIYYLWDFRSPLKVYLHDKWRKDTITPYFQQWASMAPLYADYGRYLMLQHPKSFLKYYMWPNLIKYYSPPPGFMGFYNLGDDVVDPIAVTWFGWKNNRIHNYFGKQLIRIAKYFSILTAIINLVFITSFIAFACSGGFRKCSYNNKLILWWMLHIWFCNMVFSVFSAPIELRYQLFPLIITHVFLGLILCFLVEEGKGARHVSGQEGHSGITSSTAELEVHTTQ